MFRSLAGMHPNNYSESHFLTPGDLDSLQFHIANFANEPHRPLDQNPRGQASHQVLADHPFGPLPTQHMAAAYNPTSTLSMHPAHNDWYTLLGPGFPASGYPNPGGIVSGRPQHGSLSYAEKGVQTIQLDYIRRGELAAQEQARQQPIPRHLVSQVAFKSTRHQAGFTGPDVITFAVEGQEGVRLSDAIEGKWVGFKGRDDGSLFDGTRLQILIRLHPVGCSPWQNKVPTVDSTPERRPITRAKLAAGVAKSVRKFIAREKLKGHAVGHPLCHRGDVSLENVFLTRIIRASAASWQPEIFVERPSVSSQVAVSSSLSPLA